MKGKQPYYLILILLVISPAVPAAMEDVCCLKSPDGLNAITVSLSNDGRLFYRAERGRQTVLDPSPLGLRCKDEDFSRGLTLKKITPETTRREQYQLVVGNRLNIDTLLNERQLTLKNDRGSVFGVDLVAGDEGVGFRCRLGEDGDALYEVMEETTGFHIPPSATAWLQPYHAAGKYTPAYEDFYFQVAPGTLPPVSREKPRGWCLPALFQIPSASSWMLIAESGTDGFYCGCHLEVDPSKANAYKIAFAYEDEVTAAGSFDANARPAPVRTRATPWRIIIMGDQANDILNSTLITDLAAPSRIEDTSWIEPGRASWSWWSHPEGENTRELYNRFTDLAAEFGWEYTLFDAGWWKVDLSTISRYAQDKGVKPLIWMYAGDFYDPDKRRRKLDQAMGKGVRGIKVDFWCSDRQDAMAAIHATLQDAAERRLVVSLHGCTIPRGWHRTWPNLLTAEATLGTESYFYEERYPQKVAEMNTLVPFIRNVMGPVDTTPVTLTIRKFPRKTTAVHELATALVFTTGLIHYAESVETMRGFPQEVREVLRAIPAAWDQTDCLIGDPGRCVVLARRSGDRWWIAGLNGTDGPMPVSLNPERFGSGEWVEITEGENPLTEFAIRNNANRTEWKYSIPPRGGFVLNLNPAR